MVDTKFESHTFIPGAPLENVFLIQFCIHLIFHLNYEVVQNSHFKHLLPNSFLKYTSLQKKLFETVVQRPH
jgi:hypothetical protein